MGKLQSAWATGAGVAVLIGLIIAEAPAFLVVVGISGVVTLARFLYESWTYEERKEEYERERAERIREYEEALRRWEAKCKAFEQAHQERLREHQEALRQWEAECEDLKKNP
jgi:Skp family chaperone for outer membrane proteins